MKIEKNKESERSSASEIKEFHPRITIEKAKAERQPKAFARARDSRSSSAMRKQNKK